MYGDQKVRKEKGKKTPCDATCNPTYFEISSMPASITTLWRGSKNDKPEALAGSYKYSGSQTEFTTSLFVERAFEDRRCTVTHSCRFKIVVSGRMDSQVINKRWKKSIKLRHLDDTHSRDDIVAVP